MFHYVRSQARISSKQSECLESVFASQECGAYAALMPIGRNSIHSRCFEPLTRAVACGCVSPSAASMSLTTPIMQVFTALGKFCVGMSHVGLEFKELRAGYLSAWNRRTTSKIRLCLSISEETRVLVSPLKTDTSGNGAASMSDKLRINLEAADLPVFSQLRLTNEKNSPKREQYQAQPLIYLMISAMIRTVRCNG
jgi:hypothetical protein